MRREGSDWAKVRPLVAQRCRMKRVAGPVGDPQGLLGAEPCAPCPSHSWPQRWTHQFVEMSARRTRGVLQVQDDVIRQKSDPPAREPAASVDAGSSVLGTKDRARSRPAETHTWKQNSPPCDQSPDG